MKQLFILTLLLTMPLAHAAEKLESKASARSSISAKITQEPKNKITQLTASCARVSDLLKGSCGNKGHLRASLERTIAGTEMMFSAFSLMKQDETLEIMGNPAVKDCFDLWFSTIKDLKKHKKRIDRMVKESHTAAMTKDREQLTEKIKQLEKERDAERTEKLELQAALTAAVATKSTPTPTASTASTEAGSAAFDCGGSR